MQTYVSTCGRPCGACVQDASEVCTRTRVWGLLALTAGPPSGGGQGSLANTLREVEPTSHLGVPRVWEKIMERIQEVGAGSGFIRRKMLLWAMSVALEQNVTCPSRYHAGRDEGTGGRVGAGRGHATVDGTGWAHPGDPCAEALAGAGRETSVTASLCSEWGARLVPSGVAFANLERLLGLQRGFLTSVGVCGRGHADVGFSSLQVTTWRSPHCL